MSKVPTASSLSPYYQVRCVNGGTEDERIGHSAAEPATPREGGWPIRDPSYWDWPASPVISTSVSPGWQGAYGPQRLEAHEGCIIPDAIPRWPLSDQARRAASRTTAKQQHRGDELALL